MPSLYSWAVFACSLLPHTVVSMPQTAVLVPALQPVIQGPASAGPAPSCGGCVVVADVAGLVWYKEIFVNTIGTEFRSVGFTNNRTRTTSTIFRSAEAGFTYTPNGAPNSAAPTPLINFGPFYTIGGATLTSPTAYNVYSAFTVTTSSLVNNVCVASSYSSTLPSAFTQNLAAASGTVYLNAEGEQSFINYIRLTTCSGAGASIVGLQLIHVQNTIAIVTSTFPTVSLMAASRTFPSVTEATQTSSTQTSSTTTGGTPSGGTPSRSTPSGRTTSAGTISPSASIVSVTGLGSTTLSITGLGSTTLATLTAILTSKRVYPSALAPVLILGNLTTIHGNPTPLPLPILSVPGDNATLSSGATVSIIIATGTGASSGNYTAVVPYISRGTRARSRPGRLWLSLWGTCLLGMVGVVSYL